MLYQVVNNLVTSGFTPHMHRVLTNKIPKRNFNSMYRFWFNEKYICSSYYKASTLGSMFLTLYLQNKTKLNRCLEIFLFLFWCDNSIISWGYCIKDWNTLYIYMHVCLSVFENQINVKNEVQLAFQNCTKVPIVFASGLDSSEYSYNLEMLQRNSNFVFACNRLLITILGYKLWI